MANIFKSSAAASIGQSGTTVYTVPVGTTTTVIGLSVANTLTTSTEINISVRITKSGVSYFVVRNAPVIPGGALIVLGGDQKLVLEAGNSLEVFSSLNGSADAVLSYLEIN
jgi:hypothetical protein